MSVVWATQIIEMGMTYLLIGAPESFDTLTPIAQETIRTEWQQHARDSGVEGLVVAVWLKPDGTSGFLGPETFNWAYNDWTLQKVLAHPHKVPISF